MPDIHERDELVSSHEMSLSEGAVNEINPIEVINGFPMYEKGSGVDNYVIDKRIGWDDRFGATYLAYNEENKLAVLRLANEECHVAKMEASFLKQAEMYDYEYLFSTIHSVLDYDSFYFLALNFRAGPTLQKCLKATENGRFGHGSGARLAEDILVILHAIHKMGYAACNLSPGAFHLDEETRHLFMADISEIRKRNETEGEKKKPVYWVGGPHSAPIAYHMDSYEEDGISPSDEVESWFYLFLHLIHGLPWDHMNIDDLKWSKLDYETLDKLFVKLPKQYRAIHEIITGDMGEMSDKAYDDVLRLVREIYMEVEGVEDRQENYDFEPEPTEVQRLECIPEGNEEEE